MRLGSQTASLINNLQARAVIGQPEPVVGMGVTILMWTDRNAATIFRVFRAGKAVIVETRDDDARLVSGSIMSEAQQYEFKTRVNGARRYFRRNDNGMWDEVRKNEATGRWIKTNGSGLRIGQRDTYRDPTF